MGVESTRAKFLRKKIFVSCSNTFCLFKERVFEFWVMPFIILCDSQSLKQLL